MYKYRNGRNGETLGKLWYRRYGRYVFTLTRSNVPGYDTTALGVH